MTAAELRAAMRALSISREWLADRLGVHPATFARWERGDAPVPLYVAFAVSLIGQLAAVGIAPTAETTESGSGFLGDER